MIWKYGTFIPALVQALEHTEGDVVELGVGLCSTPLLFALCTFNLPTRNVYSFDDDAKWIDVMQSRCQSEDHAFRHVGTWDVAYNIVEKIAPSVVLLDHGQTHTLGNKVYHLRKSALRRLANLDAVLVMHDFEDEVFQLDEDFVDFTKSFKFGTVLDAMNPSTLIVSNTRSLKWLSSTLSVQARSLKSEPSLAGLDTR